jgi:hypothetical protein
VYKKVDSRTEIKLYYEVNENISQKNINIKYTKFTNLMSYLNITIE